MGNHAVRGGCKSKRMLARHRTTNWSSYNVLRIKRGSLAIRLDTEMTRIALPGGGPGCPAMVSNAAIRFCLMIEVLFKFLVRQTTGMVANWLKLANLDRAIPD